jgi:lipid II:glycine glycyltransferase (peptidoglycan interpeptide bridge formation enzyme)
MESNIWNSLISSLPNPHFLQSYEWGQAKAMYGWQPIYLAWDERGRVRVERDSNRLSSFLFPPSAAALVLKRTIPMAGMSARLSILYAPKGPLLDWKNVSLRDRVLDDLQSFSRREGAIFLKIDPDLVLGTGIPSGVGDVPDANAQAVVTELSRRGWRYSADQIQFKNTVQIDLGPSEEELLGRMKQKTRYNVRLAEKKGVTLRIGTPEDFGMLYRMYAETSVRDGFVIRDEAYYRTVWGTFMAKAPTPNRQSPSSQSPTLQSPSCEPLIAAVDNEPVAAIFLFYFAGRAYYVYGMSRELHREKMPSYLLQWEAIKRARARGSKVYDLWGAPDVFDERDSMWGVYRFKEGLGGTVVRTLGAWDFAPNPFWYKLYSEILPRLLDVMRSRGKARTRQSLGGA